MKLWDIIKDKATAIGMSLIELPPLTERVLRKAERGDLQIRVSLQELEAIFTANTRALNRLTWMLAFGFTLGASAYLLVNNLAIEARYGFAFSGLLLLAIILGSGSGQQRRRIHRHPPPLPRREQD